ncbi:hypothetical protein [Nonomuraea sp. B5E05]|uniref:hypothetical protein n=1 Tax=Nonomuraea sp. B5E05 TaxID=3153569 RepID=UPI0032612169
MRKRRWLALFLVISLMLAAFPSPASAAVVALSWTADGSGATYYWDTYPDTSSPGWYISVYDAAPDGYGVRGRGRADVYSDYWDNTSAAFTEQIFWPGTIIEQIQACNRDKLSNGTVRVFNCDSWRSTGR